MSTDRLFDMAPVAVEVEIRHRPEGHSGSVAFDRFRDAMAKDPALVRELEAALQVNVDRVNPSDPGNRFVTGGAAEWIIAAAAWEAKVLTVPGGHGARGFDLLDLQDAARGLWSVKSQSARSKSAFRISNGLGGAGKGLMDPTVFLSPHLPGLVLVHPVLHEAVKAKEKSTKKGKDGQEEESDAVTLAFGVIAEHAKAHPECVIPLRVPMNEGRGQENPYLEYTQTIVVRSQFPRLSRMFEAAKPTGTTLGQDLADLARLKEEGQLTESQYAAAVQAAIAQAGRQAGR